MSATDQISAENHNFIKKIFAPVLSFEGIDESDKFVRYFCDLYRIDSYKSGLDLILTKAQERDLSFEFQIIKGWDTNLGCYLTEQSRVFNKFAGVFSQKIKKKIIIKSFLHNVLAHEMAHAVDFESGLDLDQGFRSAIGVDMKNRANLVSLQAEIKRLMVDALKAYPKEQFVAELFARYFELLSICHDVIGRGAFETRQVYEFFGNVDAFIRRVFNPKIRTKIDAKIAAKTEEITREVNLKKAKISFQDQTSSSNFHKKLGEDGKKSFAKNVRSNADYLNSWKKFEAIEDKNNK